MGGLELWGGVECTVNRTRDGYRDQCRLNGHHDRPQDLDLFADLGLKAVRYPVLWERIAPDKPADRPDACDWRWTDARLPRLRDMGIRPIAGLVHHGSGPGHTDLLDAGFAAKLGAFAGKVAERYPWIEDWTPVNEPLTTARFTALYGHWYPHRRDERSFWTALLNQVDGVRAAMAAVRRVNPQVRLIQTDDLGRTYATLPLAAQAAYDNARRWAGWDLLFGRITPHHALWERIARYGLGDRLRAIADDPCPPDVIGVNHYLTSDRFLDHRLQRYPAATHGGNGATAYADTEAVRVLDPPPGGLVGALREAWVRYATPLAVTEVHNGCTREEQLRWAAEAWDGAQALRGEGVDVRAVTAWSLFGAQGWNTLLTAHGVYEPGVYDVASGAPRPTALAALWKGLPDNAARHPVADEPGWWRRPDRLIHRPIVRPAASAAPRATPATPPLLICGATGTLGQAFARACTARAIPYVLTGRATLDLDDPASIAAALDRHRPWGVVNAAGWVRVDDAETEEAACYRANATGALVLARACAGRDIANVGFSSDLVFDGLKDAPYRESDRAAPLNAYGRSKAAFEADAPAGTLIIRTAAFFSPHDPHNFAHAVVATLAAGRRFRASADHSVTPAYVPALVDATLDLLIDGESGIRHLTNGEAVSWAAFAHRIAVACQLDPSLIDAVPGAMPGWCAARPRNAALVSERGAMLGPLTDAIALFAAARTAGRTAAASSHRVAA